MPINTQPPSPLRRALLLVVLFLSLLASLAFAQLLVYQRAARKPLRLHTPSARDALPQLPPGFHPDTATDFGDFPPVAAYRGTVAGQPRSLRIYLATIKSFDDPACPLRGEALGLYNQLFHAKPASTTASMLGTRGALELEGPVASSPQVARLRVTIIDRDLIAVAYVGPGPFTAEDTQVFASFAGPTFPLTPEGSDDN